MKPRQRSPGRRRPQVITVDGTLTPRAANPRVNQVLHEFGLLAGTAEAALPPLVRAYLAELDRAGCDDVRDATGSHYRAFVRPAARQPLPLWLAMHERHAAAVVTHLCLILDGWPHPPPRWGQLPGPLHVLTPRADTGCTVTLFRAASLTRRRRTRRLDHDLRTATVVALCEVGGLTAEIPSCRLADVHRRAGQVVVQLPGRAVCAPGTRHLRGVQARQVTLTDFGSRVVLAYVRFLRSRHLNAQASMLYSGAQDPRSPASTNGIQNTLIHMRRELGLAHTLLTPNSIRLWAVMTVYAQTTNWARTVRFMGRDKDFRAALGELRLATEDIPRIESEAADTPAGHARRW